MPIGEALKRGAGAAQGALREVGADELNADRRSFLVESCGQRNRRISGDVVRARVFDELVGHGIAIIAHFALRWDARGCDGDEDAVDIIEHRREPVLEDGFCEKSMRHFVRRCAKPA
jgi:hypothetical protein